jgi:hypothetical protein
MNAGADAAPVAQFPILDEATANYFIAPDISTARKEGGCRRRTYSLR